ncbi:HIRAN domain-containing protein [Serinicoccus kebangsaanensis]|uniref:HIRAN domain-containing protein n=1 Tax=Serinicoccus kebangsaanensis TaxID=2602069 RepID=UPI00178C4173|nr:HIRAN domain-containing protein [Serinicoccus kebangsaanensis]
MTRTSTRRLLVTRRNPETTHYEAVGELVRDENGFTFTYRDGSRALPSMPHTGQPYRSDVLFPLFSHRVISPRRADHDAYLAGLHLPPEATPFEVLTRSGGRSAVDTLELTPIPEPGHVDLCFLVHGIRHLGEAERARIDTLRPGQRLHLEAAPDTPTDEHAILVTDDGHRLGYAPRPLTQYVHPIMASEHELTVERVNHRDAGFHMRLLVRLVGTYPG